jgi:hypothetical protein
MLRGTTAIRKLPERNLSLVIRTLEDLHRTKPLEITDNTKVDDTITQNINVGENAISISIPIIDLQEKLLTI